MEPPAQLTAVFGAELRSWSAYCINHNLNCFSINPATTRTIISWQQLENSLCEQSQVKLTCQAVVVQLPVKVEGGTLALSAKIYSNEGKLIFPVVFGKYGTKNWSSTTARDLYLELPLLKRKSYSCQSYVTASLSICGCSRQRKRCLFPEHCGSHYCWNCRKIIPVAVEVGTSVSCSINEFNFFKTFNVECINTKAG